MNAHGHQRLTLDLDLVLHLAPENVRRALRALEGLGYRPQLPVPAEQFANPDRRRRWIAEKNMEDFSLVSDEHRDRTVDLFVRAPFDFTSEHEAAFIAELAPGVPMPFVRLEALIEMKEAAGRPIDLDDARHLRWIAEELSGEAADAGD